MDALTPKSTVDDGPTGWAWITLPSPVNSDPSPGTTAAPEASRPSSASRTSERQTRADDHDVAVPSGTTEHHHPGRVRAAGPDRGLRMIIAGRCSARRGGCRRVRGPGLVVGTPGGQGAVICWRSRRGCGRRPDPGPRPRAAARAGRLAVGGGHGGGRSSRGDPHWRSVPLDGRRWTTAVYVLVGLLFVVVLA